MTTYTDDELIRFLESRDERLREMEVAVAANSNPPEKRQARKEKVRKRREEVQFIKRVISQNEVASYPDLPENWEHAPGNNE